MPSQDTPHPDALEALQALVSEIERRGDGQLQGTEAFARARALCASAGEPAPTASPSDRPAEYRTWRTGP